MLTYAHVCARVLTYAHVCSRMLTYADVCGYMLAELRYIPPEADKVEVVECFKMGAGGVRMRALRVLQVLNRALTEL